MLEEIPVDSLGGPRTVLLDMLYGDSSLKTERSSPTKAVGGVVLAANVARWNMALRVEAEIVLPIGGAVVSRSGVVLLGLMPGSMCRYRSHAATGQMSWSDREERGMVVTPCCA